MFFYRKKGKIDFKCIYLENFHYYYYFFYFGFEAIDYDWIYFFFITVLPFSLLNEVLEKWIIGQEMCVIWCVVDVLCCTASILNLLIISLDRWLAISYPMRYHSFATPKRAIIAIILVWFLSILICLPPVFGWRKEPSDENKCELTDEIGYVIYSALGSFWIPSIILIIVYSRIYVVAARQTKQINKQQAQLGEIRGH